MLTFLAFLPLLAFFALILIFKKSVLMSIQAALFTLVTVSFLVWEIDTLRLVASGMKGLFISLEIILIIFGILAILEILKSKGLLTSLRNIFESISGDKRVHAILIGWGLIYFLEGVAGFGTPAIIAIPIFLALGFAPVTAVVISMVGDSVPVIFGAVGLPVTYGIMSSVTGFPLEETLARNLPVLIAGMNVFLGVLIPLILLFIFTRLEKKPFAYFREFIPFTIVAGLATSLSAFVVARFIGAELPSVIGGLFGIIVIAFMAKKKILLPASASEATNISTSDSSARKFDSLRAIFPYAFVLCLLFLSRLPALPIREFLIDLYKINLSEIFGYEINYQFSPFYTAGMIMLVSAIASVFFFKLNLRKSAEIVKTAGKKVLRPFFALFLILVFVQIYIYSGENVAGLPSMLAMLANNASMYFGGIWPFFAPFIGGLGALTAGSATVSNLIFSNLQYHIAISTDFAPLLILSLQGLGAAAGNMAALHNIIVATTVAGIAGQENLILRKTLPILFVYLLIVGILGMTLSFIL